MVSLEEVGLAVHLLGFDRRPRLHALVKQLDVHDLALHTGGSGAFQAGGYAAGVLGVAMLVLGMRAVTKQRTA
jgi:hypothetical protein